MVCRCRKNDTQDVVIISLCIFETLENYGSNGIRTAIACNNGESAWSNRERIQSKNEYPSVPGLLRHSKNSQSEQQIGVDKMLQL